MKLHKHFLEKDLALASRHYHCFKDSLELVTMHLENGNLELAKQRSIDVTRSLHELCRLAEKKNEVDRIGFYIEMMDNSGQAMQIIRRLKNE